MTQNYLLQLFMVDQFLNFNQNLIVVLGSLQRNNHLHSLNAAARSYRGTIPRLN